MHQDFGRFFSRCADGGRREDRSASQIEFCAGNNPCITRPWVISQEVIRGGESLRLLLSSREVTVDDLMEICITLYDSTCKKSDTKLRARHVLLSMAFMLLRLALNKIPVLEEGKPFFGDPENPLFTFENSCCFVWAVASDLKDGDTAAECRERMRQYRKPLSIDTSQHASEVPSDQ